MTIREDFASGENGYEYSRLRARETYETRRESRRLNHLEGVISEKSISAKAASEAPAAPAVLFAESQASFDIAERDAAICAR